MKEDDTFFSIIIPSYNRAGFIGQTIKSVLAQDYINFELIIVDDGSTDETEAVVAQFKDLRIRYFKKINEERAAARNFGVRKAIGEYVTFLDSDDLFKKNHLSVACFKIQEQDLPIFHLGYEVIDKDGQVISPWSKLPSPANEKLIEGNFFSCLGIFIKRKIILKYPFNEDRELSGSEDYELWLRIAARYSIVSFSESTALLVNHDSRSVVCMDPVKLKRRMELLEVYVLKDIEFVNRYGNRLTKLIAYRDIYLALHLALIPQSKIEATRFLMNALYKFPKVVFNMRFWVVVKKICIN